MVTIGRLLALLVLVVVAYFAMSAYAADNAHLYIHLSSQTQGS